MAFYFDSSINFLSLIFGLVAIMLASITLLYAIGISKDEKETREDLRQNKRDKFEFTLRDFSVNIFQFQNTSL